LIKIIFHYFYYFSFLQKYIIFSIPFDVFITFVLNFNFPIMIKQDYLIRMILEIITLIANALLNKQKIRKQNWIEYDCLTRQILGVPTENLKDMTPDEIREKYQGDPNEMGKVELSAMTMLKMAEDIGNENLLLKSKLRQNGLHLLKQVQEDSNTYSIQRITLIQAIENNL